MDVWAQTDRRENVFIKPTRERLSEGSLSPDSMVKIINVARKTNVSTLFMLPAFCLVRTYHSAF